MAHIVRDLSLIDAIFSFPTMCPASNSLISTKATIYSTRIAPCPAVNLPAPKFKLHLLLLPQQLLLAVHAPIPHLTSRFIRIGYR